MERNGYRPLRAPGRHRMCSKNLFLNFGTLSGVSENRSNPNPHVRCDRLPAEALSAKCRNPLRIEDPLGTAQFLALCPGVSETGPDALGNQTALQLGYCTQDGENHPTCWCGRLKGFRQTYKLNSQHPERIESTQ